MTKIVGSVRHFLSNAKNISLSLVVVLFLVPPRLYLLLLRDQVPQHLFLSEREVEIRYQRNGSKRLHCVDQLLSFPLLQWHLFALEGLKWISWQTAPLALFVLESGGVRLVLGGCGLYCRKLFLVEGVQQSIRLVLLVLCFGGLGERRGVFLEKVLGKTLGSC